MQQLKEQLKEYKSLESSSHVNIDDVLNKVTQEISELLEAIWEWNQDEIYKEAWDVLSNILSVCYELWIDFEEKDLEISDSKENSMMILLWKWNSKIQSLRKRFSRENTWVSEAVDITKKLVSSVLNFSDPSKSLQEILKSNIEKFRQRVPDYKLEIDLKDFIWEYPDFPKPWINFKDISPLLSSPEALRYAVNEMSDKCRESDVIVGLDARWFIFWSLVASNLGKPFIMLRKKWKLPWKTSQISYWLEYWKDTLELQEWVIESWKKVSIVDDLLATWWTIKAAIDLVENSWGIVNNLCFVISLDDDFLSNLPSREVLSNYKSDSLVSYN